MESEIFRAGVLPGAPSTEDEVRMLLCYLLEAAGEPMSFDQLFEVLSDNSLVNYFELTETLRYLEGLEVIAVSGGAGPKLYRNTPRGEKIAAEFERQIPFSSREKAAASAKKLLARERRRREIKATRTVSGGGFILELSIPDNHAAAEACELISLKIFAPTKETCDRLESRFLNSPLTVYKGVTALLTGDEDVLGKIFTEEEKLF